MFATGLDTLYYIVYYVLNGDAAPKKQREKRTMIALIDTFNNVVLSRHKTVQAAEAAHDKLQRKVKVANGPGSYIPTKLVEGSGFKAGDRLSAEDVASATRVSRSWED